MIRTIVVTGVVCIAAMLGGCAVALVSAYDAETDQGVTALQTGIARHLATLEQLATADQGNPKHPDCEYARYVETYAEFSADAHVLIVRNEARPKNELTVQQLQSLADSLAQGLPVVHQTATGGCMTAGAVAAARETLDQNFRAILKLELAKKSYREEQ